MIQKKFAKELKKTFVVMLYVSLIQSIVFLLNKLFLLYGRLFSMLLNFLVGLF